MNRTKVLSFRISETLDKALTQIRVRISSKLDRTLTKTEVIEEAIRELAKRERVKCSE